MPPEAPRNAKSVWDVVFWLLLLAFGCYFAYSLLQPLAAFQPYLVWWRAHATTPPTTCLPLVLMAYKSGTSTRLATWLVELMTPQRQLLHQWQSDWLLLLLRSYAAPATAPPTPQAFLTPRMFCVSIAPGLPGELLYDTPPDVTQTDINNAGVSESSMKPFHDWPADALAKQPGVALHDLWVAVLAHWGCYNNQGSFVINQDRWIASKSNFLWQFYGIPSDARGLQAFVLDSTYSPEGELWYPEIFETLLGSKNWGTGSGWVGAVQFLGNRVPQSMGTSALDQLKKHLYGHLNPPDPLPPGHGETCSAASIVNSLYNTTAAGASVGAHSGRVGTVLGGLVGGVVGVLSNLNCF